MSAKKRGNDLSPYLSELRVCNARVRTQRMMTMGQPLLGNANDDGMIYSMEKVRTCFVCPTKSPYVAAQCT